MIGSAPGKVLLLGEYAVVEGAPAIVLAVNRRATTEITPVAGDELTVHAPDLGLTARGAIDDTGRLTWRAHAADLRLVTAVIKAIVAGPESWARAAALRGSVINLSTAAFFDTPGEKLGLGSSAALTVALAGALVARLDLPPLALPELVAIHRAFQGGRGSGVDIAAAHTGGVSVYTADSTTTAQRAATAPRATPIALPTDLHWAVVYTGRAASTPAMLSTMADYRTAHTAVYLRQIHRLAAITDTALIAAGRADTPAIINAVDDYAEALDELGRAAGIDIVSAPHRELRNLAKAHRVSYKTSGSGGGDIGIACSGDSGHITGFAAAAMAAGYRMIDVAIDPHGLTVT